MHLKKILIPLLLSASYYAQEPNWPTDAVNAYSSNFGEYRDDHFHMGLDIRTNGVIGHKVYAFEKVLSLESLLIILAMEKRSIKKLQVVKL